MRITVPDKKISSPDKRLEACLAPTAGSVWDLSHASLTLRDLSFEARTFGWNGVWSSCSRYFAISEWLSSDAAAHSPDMRLIVIDVERGRECVVEQVSCGFVEPMHFQDNAVKYSKIEQGMKERAVMRRRIGELEGWQPVRDHRPVQGEEGMTQHP
ncbi:MAG: hypothetical protein ACYC7L_00510 [Nitrospirota bacterium]